MFYWYRRFSTICCFLTLFVCMYACACVHMYTCATMHCACVCVCGCVHADHLVWKHRCFSKTNNLKSRSNVSPGNKYAFLRIQWLHKCTINDPGRVLFPSSSHHLPLKYFGVSNLTGGQSFIQRCCAFYVYESHESHHRSGFVLRNKLLCSIWSIVYFRT